MDSCMPAPVCKSSDYDFTNMNGFIENTDYLGDPSSGNWVFSGDPLMYNNEAVLLTMTSDSSGTLLSSTRYVWYGKMSATMKTSRGAGVVTAFIMMSDVKDEIDFEFIGTDIETAQSNYYFQGITDCTFPRVVAFVYIG
jgi:beta-glucanase (GH16 family)